MNEEDAADHQPESSATDATDATGKTPRTVIRDLAPAADEPSAGELSEEQAAQVVGGVVLTGQYVPVLLAGPLTPAVQKATSVRAFTTGGIPPDQDTVQDKE
jgi:hypothetical protein